MFIPIIVGFWAARFRIFVSAHTAFIGCAIGGANFIWFAFFNVSVTSHEKASAIAFVSFWRRVDYGAPAINGRAVAGWPRSFGLSRWYSSHDPRQNQTSQKRNHSLLLWSSIFDLLKNEMKMIVVRTTQQPRALKWFMLGFDSMSCTIP